MTERELFTPEFPGLALYSQSVYYVAAIMCSVGYGDIVPRSDWGYIVTIGTQIIGLWMSGLMLRGLFSTMSLTKQEKNLSESVDFLLRQKQEKELAAILLQAFFKAGKESGTIRRVKKMHNLEKQRRLKAANHPNSKNRTAQAGHIIKAMKKAPKQEYTCCGMVEVLDPIVLKANAFKSYRVHAADELQMIKTSDDHLLEDLLLDLAIIVKMFEDDIKTVIVQQNDLNNAFDPVMDGLLVRLNHLINIKFAGSHKLPMEITKKGDVLLKYTKQQMASKDVNAFIVA
jgi:hypothetical protein